jgi:dinuclear metal center YbgI/SA1388 family protein
MPLNSGHLESLDAAEVFVGVKTTVDDIIDVIEQIAPLALAEQWDNCGLQVGLRSRQVKKVWVALDPLLPVVEAAAKRGIDLIITHHPLLFRSVKSIDLESAIGKVIAKAVENRIALYAAHTNLDSAHHGINRRLADLMGLSDLEPLVPAGTDSDLAMDRNEAAQTGLGRIGWLDPPLAVGDLVEPIKRCLKLNSVRIAGDTRLQARRAAVCSGAGSSLMEAFLTSDAQVYISGDLRYHDARAVEEAGRALIDVGHFASERIVIDSLVDQLRRAAKMADWVVSIDPCRLERDPFQVL